MIRTRFGKAAGIFFILMMLFTSIFGAIPIKAADNIAPSSKVSSLLSLRVKIKTQALAQAGNTPQGNIVLPGSDIQATSDSTQMNREKVFLYFAQKPTAAQLSELAAQGVTAYPDSWIPPVGNHTMGFILADMPVDKLDTLAAKNYIVQMDTAEEQASPQNDLAETAMGVGSVWSGGDTGVGVTVAVLDSGIDTTNPDFPALNTSNSKDYSNYPALDDTITNTVTGHGTHVTGSVLGRGVNSATYKGVAPGANLVFLKIGDDTTGSATSAAIVGAIHAAVDTYHTKIITMSYGVWSEYHDGSDARCQAVDYAISQGVTVFMSAGNNASNGWHYSGTIAPNSTTADIPVTIASGTDLLFDDHVNQWSIYQFQRHRIQRVRG
jgi:subtilisin family serine protease